MLGIVSITLIKIPKLDNTCILLLLMPVIFTWVAVHFAWLSEVGSVVSPNKITITSYCCNFCFPIITEYEKITFSRNYVYIFVSIFMYLIIFQMFTYFVEFRNTYSASNIQVSIPACYPEKMFFAPKLLSVWKSIDEYTMTVCEEWSV